MMRGLYGRYFSDRYLAVAAEVPARATVVEVCAGDCYLYLHYLRPKSVTYLGLDLSAHLVRWAQAQGVNARQWNMWEDEIPSADVVIMQAGLYHFMPQTKAIIQKMLAAARQAVIIAEPIQNITSSSNPAMAWLGRQLVRLTVTERIDPGRRFERQSLMVVFQSLDEFKYAYLIPGGKEMVGVFRGGGAHGPARVLATHGQA
jgi:hypothetical protein